MTTDSARLSVKEKIGYGLGDTASHFVWDMVGFWILIFYTDTFGISAAAAGTIMFIARFWDMASDPLMGVISDRTRSRWGKFRPYILWMAVPYGVLAVLTFSTPDLGPTGKVIYAAVTYLLLMTAYTAINLPYSSLGAVMTADSMERTSLNTYRFICGFGGQLIVTGLALTLAGYFGGGDDAKGYRLTVTLFAVIAVVLFLVTFLSTRERIQPPPTQQDSIKQDFRVLLRNRPWLILAAVGVVSFVMFALQNLSLAYYFKYYIGKEKSVELFNVVGAIALIVALPLAKPLAQRFGKKNVFIGSSLLSGTFFCLLYLPGAESLGWVYAFNVLGKMAYAPAVPLLWTMIADAADYAEWTSGRRATGLFFSAATFAQKGGWGLGGALAGWLLAAYGYVEGGAEQTVHALTGIKLLISVFPGVLYISCALVLIFYPLDEATVATMKRELEERRGEEAPEPAQ